MSEAPRPAPARPTRVALVGAGYIADFHLAILQDTPGVEVVAICDRDRERAAKLAARYGIEHVETEIGALAAHEVRVAHVLVPPDLHALVGRQLLEANIGVFIEKPVAPTLAEACELEGLARDKGLPFGVNHNAAFVPVFQRLRDSLAKGEIGKLEHVQLTLSVPLRQLDAQDFSHWMFREPRNIVFEQAPHPFSQLFELLGRLEKMDVSVLSKRELAPGQPFYDRWHLAARAERGTADVHLAFGPSFTRNTITAIGSDGCIEIDLIHGLFAIERKTPWLDFWNSFLAGWRRGGSMRRGALRGLFLWTRQTLGLGRREDAFFAGMRASIRDFHAALLAGTKPQGDGEQALAVLEWCEAAVLDVEQAQPVVELAPTTAAPRKGEVCVLGGTGFIGRPTLRALHERGLPTTAVVRRTTGLPPIVVEGVRAGHLHLRLASLERTESLREAVRGARVVLHLATGGGNSWEEIERAMVQGTRALAEACADEEVERLIYVSSTAALYLGQEAGESIGDDVGPDPHASERALYARGKVAAEHALLAVAAARGLRVTIVRPAVVVGAEAPLQHSGLGLWTRDNHCVGWGRGDRPVPLVDVDDVADLLARLVAHDGTELDGKALNVAARTGLTSAQVVRAFRTRTGRDFRFHPRSLLLSQTMEIGKWIVKKVGGRKDAEFPSYRDLKSRSLHPIILSPLSREVLGWKPVDDGLEILRRVLAGRTP